MQQDETARRNFVLLVDNGSAKRRRNRSLCTFWRHEQLSMQDGDRDHDATVVTAEKVVIARQKGEGLDCPSGMLQKRGGNGTSVPQVVRSFPSGAERVACQRSGQEHIEESINGSRTRSTALTCSIISNMHAQTRAGSYPRR